MRQFFILTTLCFAFKTAISMHVTYNQLQNAMNSFNADRFSGFNDYAYLPNATPDVLNYLNAQAALLRDVNKPSIERESSIRLEPDGNCDNPVDILNDFFEYEPCGKARPLHTLDLSNCNNLTMEHLNMMCDNPFFYRLKNITIPNHFADSRENILRIINLILKSEVGSIRGLPQLSAKYRVPSSVIELTFAAPAPGDFNKEYNRFDFTINYERPDGQPCSFCPSKRSIKFVKVNFQ
jgi:hypothetical protein